MEQGVGDQNKPGSQKQTDANNCTAQKRPDHGSIGFREQAGHHRDGRDVNRGADDVGGHASIHGRQGIEPEEEGKEHQHVVEGVEHQCHGQPEAVVELAHEEQDHQADDVEHAPEIAEKFDEAGFGGKLFINGKIELVVHDGNHHVGHEGEHHQDLHQHRGFHQGQYCLEFLDHRSAALLSTLFFLLEQQCGIPLSHGLHGPGAGQGRAHVYQQQVVQVQPSGHQRRGETAQYLSDDPAGGDQRKEPFGLSGVEQVVGQIPEQKRQKDLVLRLEHKQSGVNQVDAKGDDGSNASDGQCAENEQPGQQPSPGQAGHESGHDTHDEKGQHRVEHINDRHVFDAISL